MKAKRSDTDWMKVFKWLAILLPILLFYFGWFMPGLIIGGDFQYRPPEYFAEHCDYNTWQSQMAGGSYTVYSAQLPKYPIFVTSCLMSKVMPYELMSRLLWLFPILLVGIAGMYSLLKYWWPKKHYLHVVGTVFFMINPALLERLYRAHVWMPMVYALMPWIVLYFYKALKTQKIKNIVFSASISSFMYNPTPYATIIIIAAPTAIGMKFTILSTKVAKAIIPKY